jgi:transcriptional regulator
MHPNPAFRMATDPLAFVAAQAFGTLFVAADGQLLAAHVPLLVVDGMLQFHLASSNAITAPLAAGTAALISVVSPGHYVSANWYPDAAGNVPTWNYTAVEIEGRAIPMDLAQLEALLNTASATFEPRVGEDWQMAKMERRRAEAMMRAITGFVLRPEAIRATHKHSQNRSDADAESLAAGMAARGDAAGAAAIRAARP